jgi:ClpP class serine protease
MTSDLPCAFVRVGIHFNSKYSRVKKWTVGLGGGGEQIAVIRASGSISRTRGPLSSPGSGIIAEQLIEKLRSVRGKITARNNHVIYQYHFCKLSYW